SVLRFLCYYPFAILHHFDFFFYNDTATTDIYTLSLHDALPILDFFYIGCNRYVAKLDDDSYMILKLEDFSSIKVNSEGFLNFLRDRKSTRLNSSHVSISYAVFCLKKKNKRIYTSSTRV